MHPNTVDLYAGLFGTAIVPEEFELGRGVVISQTYAHFMAPFMMAFAPAGCPRFRAFRNLGITISIQIRVPRSLPSHPAVTDALATLPLTK